MSHSQKQYGSSRAAAGFTLIELLIVVAIVGIIASVAYPAYNAYMQDSRRARARAALTAFASVMQRYYSEHLTYAGAANNHVPLIYAKQVPVQSDSPWYKLRVQQADANGYVLRAMPVNAQTGDGFLQLDSTGQRAWDRNDDQRIATPQETCWQKTCW